MKAKFCEACNTLPCPLKDVERRAVIGRDFCTRAVHNGVAGEMTSRGFRPWHQVFRKMRIGGNLTGTTVIHYINR